MIKRSIKKILIKKLYEDITTLCICMCTQQQSPNMCESIMREEIVV